jgi:hypothetical protein
VRSEAEISRAEAAPQLAKGLEFRAVIVMACDQDIIPNAERIKAIIDDSDLHPRPGSSADHQRRHLLAVRGGPAWEPQPARSVGWGGWKLQSAPTEADERN